MSQHIVPLRTNFAIFGALLALLALTVGVSFLDLGQMNFVVAMAIALVKAILILLYFMHVRYSSRVTWVFAGSAFLWLGILIVMTLNDFLTRGWLAMSGK